jgi:hypothetical protein
VPERIIEQRRLEPGESAQFGRFFNAITQRPNLRVTIDVPEHVRHQVKLEDKLLGKQEEPDKAYWVFTVKNQSTWTAFVTFVEDLEK